MEKTMKDRKGEGFFGLLLLVVGGLFLANNILDIEINAYLINWKTIVLLFGAIIFVTGDDKTFGALVMAFAGIALYSDYIDVSLGTALGDYWPVFLIIMGLGAILKGVLPGKASKKEFNIHCSSDDFKDRGKKPPAQGAFENNDRDYMDDYIMFRSIEEANYAQNFKGGKLSCVFGAVILDLRGAKLSEGRNVLQIFQAFSGIELIVPEDWKITTDTSVVFGGIDDQRYGSNKDNVDQDKILEIRGTIVFGGLELKN